ncbi:MAG: DNA-3-methyladenine glycosylase [Actinomycetota bacterium]
MTPPSSSGPRASRGARTRLAPLPRSFYARPSTVVARDLLGRLLIRRRSDVTLVGRIVECEAYQEGDPASHSFRGLTTRTEVMFGPPGHLYVYFTYGMHFCANVVTGRRGEGSAVLLRAVEPLEGIEWMRRRRGVADPQALCSGPARLTQAFGIGRPDDGVDLVSGRDLFFSEGRPLVEAQIGAGPRVGISVATDRVWRYFEAGSQFVSRGPSRRARSRGPSGRGGR